jgi:hypothetical protein
MVMGANPSNRARQRPETWLVERTVLRFNKHPAFAGDVSSGVDVVIPWGRSVSRFSLGEKEQENRLGNE